MVERAPEMTDEEFKDYVGELTEDRLTAICGEHRTISSQLECVRDAAFRGFDPTGEAKRNCDAGLPMEGLLRCAVMGGLGYQLAIEARLDRAQDYNWQDPEAALKASFDSIARDAMKGCLEAPLAQIEACVFESIGSFLSLSEQQVSTCNDSTDSKKSLKCMLRVHLMQRFETAIDRMGSGDGQRA